MHSFSLFSFKDCAPLHLLKSQSKTDSFHLYGIYHIALLSFNKPHDSYLS